MSSKHCFRNLSCLEKSTKKLRKIKKIFFLHLGGVKAFVMSYLLIDLRYRILNVTFCPCLYFWHRHKKKSTK